MLIAFSTMKGSSIEGIDKHLGTLVDLVFDGDSFAVRYAAVDTGNWLPGREVPIQPTALTDHDWAARTIQTKLLRDAVENSPVIESAMPVSRKMEMELIQHYDWPAYWAIDPVYSAIPPISKVIAPEQKAEIESHQINLRSAREVMHYRIHESDGEIGSVHDLILDDESWVVRYIIVDIGKWLPGKKVMVATSWVKRISWTEGLIHVELTKSDVEHSPRYDSHETINRRDEEHLYDYHGRPKYWSKQDR